MKNNSKLIVALKNLGLSPEDIGLNAEILLTKGKDNPYEKRSEGKELKKGLEIEGEIDEKEILASLVAPILEDYVKPLKNEIKLLKGKIEGIEKDKNSLKKAHSSFSAEKEQEFELIKARLETLENTPLFGRKSFDREKGFLEKALDPNLERSSKTLSLDNKQEISKILMKGFDESMEKGTKNSPWGKAIMTFESTGNLTPEIREVLQKEGFEFEN